MTFYILCLELIALPKARSSIQAAKRITHTSRLARTDLLLEGGGGGTLGETLGTGVEGVGAEFPVSGERVSGGRRRRHRNQVRSVSLLLDLKETWIGRNNML